MTQKDVITFTPPVGPSLVDASLVTVGFTPATNIDFIGATLNGNPLALFGNPGIFEVGGLLTTPASGVLTLTVHGFAGTSLMHPETPITASYAGTVNVTAVPEPETYGMMLGGLGVLAFLARRRRTS